MRQLHVADLRARRQDWPAFRWAAENLLNRDASPQTAAELLPLLRRAATVTQGTQDETKVRSIVAQALWRLGSTEAEIEFRKLLEDADSRQDYRAARASAGGLINLSQAAGRLVEALTLVEVNKGHTLRGGFGPWTQLGDEGQRLQILVAMGNDQQVLDEIGALRQRMAALPDSSDQPETVSPFNVRESILDTGNTAALNLRRWEEALDFNAERLAWKRRRGASALDLASAEFADYFPLLRLGRFDEARTLVLGCRLAFEREGHLKGLEQALSALASLEDALGHGDQAVRLEADSLRISYTIGEPDDIGISHNNLAGYLPKQGDRREALAHDLAAAIIAYQTSSGSAHWLRALVTELRDANEIPGWDEVCDLIGRRTAGVKLADLVARLPTRAPDGPAALAEVLRLARELPPAEALELDRHIAAWEPELSALLVARAGSREAADLLGRALTARAQQRDWAALAEVLQRIAAGDLDRDVLAGLDAIDTAIAERALDALSGQAEIDPNAWRALADRQALVELVAKVVAAARGDQEAADALQPMLADMAQSKNWSALAGVLDRILAGERDHTLRNGLDAIDTAVVEKILSDLADEPKRDDPGDEQ